MPASQGWILYDDACGFCSRWVGFWKETVRRRGFDVTPLQAPWVRGRVEFAPEQLLDDLRLLHVDGTVTEGADVYRFVMRRIWWAYPAYCLSTLPILRGVFDRTYAAFKRNRYRVSRSCGLGPESP